VSPRILGGAALAVLTLGLGVYGGNQVLRVTHLRREMEVVERDLVTLRARAAELSRTVEQLRNDPAYLEKLAREEYGFVRPGETVLKFPPSGGRRDTTK
jgi:cell division protein FtsB